MQKGKVQFEKSTIFKRKYYERKKLRSVCGEIFYEMLRKIIRFTICLKKWNVGNILRQPTISRLNFSHHHGLHSSSTTSLPPSLLGNTIAMTNIFTAIAFIYGFKKSGGRLRLARASTVFFRFILYFFFLNSTKMVWLYGKCCGT